MLKKLFLFLFVLLCFFSTVSAEKTSGKDLYRYTLSNGLELYVTENHSVPLVYIEIAVKAGAAAQTPETDGLFHLYEHMMFRGNAEYTDASAVLRALNDMGVSGLNGSTEEDHVNYFFTVPSGLLYKGLEFWSSAMRTPLIKSGELEAEKRLSFLRYRDMNLIRTEYCRRFVSVYFSPVYRGNSTVQVFPVSLEMRLLKNSVQFRKSIIFRTIQLFS